MNALSRQITIKKNKKRIPRDTINKGIG